MGPVGMNPAQLLIFYEACSESCYTDPLAFRAAALGNMNLKTEFQDFKICRSQLAFESARRVAIFPRRSPFGLAAQRRILKLSGIYSS